jgi:hypothetical protein
MEFYYKNMKITKYNYGVRSYPKLVLNKLKVMGKKLFSFIHVMRFSLRKYFKQIQNISN